MDIDLIYFSGTGNSYKIIESCGDAFVQKGCDIRLSSVVDRPEINQEADWAGFCFPVYAFGIPRICRKYLAGLPALEKTVKAFVLITAGSALEAGFSVRESTRLLKSRGFDVSYTRVIQMPSNWTVAMNPPPEQEALSMIRQGVAASNEAAEDILNRKRRYHEFNYPPTYTRLGFYKDYYLFKWLGLSNLWREFRTDESCDACGVCEKLCPTQSIVMGEEGPKWSKTCEQCMRCVNYCPNQAIFQKSGGSIKGKNVYVEPSFRPLKLNKR